MKIQNNEDLSVGDMAAEMLEKQPLPIGRTQFMEWSDRIIAGAQVKATADSLRFALASMLMHLGPTEAFKPDAYFMLALRKGAVNETAHAMMTELKEQQDAMRRTKEDKNAEDTAFKLKAVDSGGGVLENQSV